MTDAWGDLATYRQKKRQKFKVYLTKGVSVNPKAYCCDDNTINDQKPPVAILTATPNPIYEGEDLTLDMTGSYDPDGGGIADPGGYEITDGIGGTYAATKTQAGIVYANAGRYEARGVVTDADGLMGEASTWVEVLSADGVNPPEPPPNGGGKVLIASYGFGVFLAEDIFVAAPAWEARNTGLAGNGLLGNELRVNPWDLTKGIFLSQEGIHTGEDIWDSLVQWTTRLTHAQARTLCGGLGVTFFICDLVFSPCQEGLGFAAVAAPSGVGASAVHVIRTIDGGVIWTYRGPSTFTTGDFGHSHYAGAEARGGKILCSSHDADRVWLQANGFLDESNEQGVNFANLNNALGFDEQTGLRVPYHDNPADDIMFVFGQEFGATHLVRKSTTHGAGFTVYDKGTYEALWRHSLGASTWGKQRGHAVALAGGAGNSHFLTSDDGLLTWDDQGQIPTFVPGGQTRQIWSHSGFPYDYLKHYCGRKEASLDGNEPDPDPVMVIWTTENRGRIWVNRTGNLYDDFGVLSIVAIVPYWLEE